MSNDTENKLKNQEKAGDRSYQLELQESHIEDKKYDEVEK